MNSNTRTRYTDYSNNFLKYAHVKSELIYCVGETRKPFITICIPTYKRDSLLKATLYSVYNQLSVQFEYDIIVVDNNPDISNNSVLNCIKDLHFNNIKYYRNSENLGMFGNWNRCIELSNSEWICMLHDDDLIDEDYLLRMYFLLTSNTNKNKPIGYIRTAHRTLWGGNTKISINLKHKIKKLYRNKLQRITKLDVILNGNAGCLGAPTCGTIISKSAMLSLGGYNQELYPSADTYPPYFMLDKYGVFCTVDTFGTRCFGDNESCKIETFHGWLREYVLFQNFLSTENKFAKKFIDYFRDQQYILFVEDYVYKLAMLNNIIVNISDFNSIYVPNYSRARIALLKAIRSLRHKYVLIMTWLFG